MADVDFTIEGHVAHVRLNRPQGPQAIPQERSARCVAFLEGHRNGCRPFQVVGETHAAELPAVGGMKKVSIGGSEMSIGRHARTTT